MRILLTFALLLPLAGCSYTATGTKSLTDSNYQFVTIDGGAYVLDQGSGRLYAVEKSGDGFNISRQVGVIGRDY